MYNFVYVNFNKCCYDEQTTERIMEAGRGLLIGTWEMVADDYLWKWRRTDYASFTNIEDITSFITNAEMSIGEL